jgi:hypothetical protein
VVLALSAALAAAPARAAEDAGLAFVLGPGSHLALGAGVVPLPEGTRLELLVIGEKKAGEYQLQLRPGGLVLPELALGESGQRLRVRIAGPSAGWLAPQPDGLAVELPATVQVEVGDGVTASTGEYALAFTTGASKTVAAMADSDVLAPDGEVVDYTSRSARLVATGTIAAGSPVAPGEPLVVVLEGSFEGLPADLR